MAAKRLSLLPTTAAATLCFLHLPREIREIIYEFCLCIDGYIVPYKENVHRDHRSDTDQKPTVALLTTNQQIRDEALPVLFSKNKWRIVDERWPVNQSSVIKTHRDLFSHVIVHCHQLDIIPECLKLAAQYARRNHVNDKQRIRDNVHDYISAHLVAAIRAKIHTAMTMPHLSVLAVGFKGLYCPLGCCRIEVIDEIVRTIAIKWDDLNVACGSWKPKYKIAFVGIKNEEEELALEPLNQSTPPIPWTTVYKKPKSNHGGTNG